MNDGEGVSSSMCDTLFGLVICPLMPSQHYRPKMESGDREEIVAAPPRKLPSDFICNSMSTTRKENNGKGSTLFLMLTGLIFHQIILPTEMKKFTDGKTKAH